MYILSRLLIHKGQCVIMDAKRLSLLEERLDRIEKALANKNEEKKPTNEIAPIIAKAIPMIVKNLPMILSVLPDLTKALESDQVNDNSDKVDMLNQFSELGQKVADMFKNANG